VMVMMMMMYNSSLAIIHILIFDCWNC